MRHQAGWLLLPLPLGMAGVCRARFLTSASQAIADRLLRFLFQESQNAKFNLSLVMWGLAKVTPFEACCLNYLTPHTSVVRRLVLYSAQSNTGLKAKSGCWPRLNFPPESPRKSLLGGGWSHSQLLGVLPISFSPGPFHLPVIGAL